MNAMRPLAAVATILFVVCIPILLLTSNARAAANDIRLYEYGFDRYGASAATGLEEAELLQTADSIITYFNSDDELLDVDVFSERAIAHMKDVKGLIRLVYTLQIATASYIGAYVVLSFALRKRAFWRDLARRLTWGGAATIAILAVLGIWAALGFEELFLLFHLTSFSNDLWQLNPGDNMLLMFPQAFFNDAALIIAGATIAEAVIIGGLAWVLLRARGRAAKRLVSTTEAISSDS